MSDHESIFAELVTFSRERHDEAFANQRADDVLLGAIVASIVKAGNLLIGVNSDGTNHHVRFEHPSDHDRVLFRLTHLTEDLAAASIQGHLGALVVGYGRRVDDASATWRAFESHVASNEPGVIGFDADLAAGYIYAQVLLVLDLDRYIARDLRVDLSLVKTHIAAVVDSLRKYLDRHVTSPRPTTRSTAHRRELDEARDEILIGHVIAELASRGHSVVGVAADSDYQRVRFRCIDDALHSLVVAIDRTASRFVNVRRHAVVTVQAEVKRKLPRAAELLTPWEIGADKLAAIAKLGATVERTFDSLFATLARPVELGDPLGEQTELTRNVLASVDSLRDALADL